eukprot:SAG11_NODE_15184_length_586_cov_1.053388_1_plen_112_part_10
MSADGKPRGERAPLYQKSDKQIRVLNQWWKTKTRGGNIDKTLISLTDRQKLANKAGLPLKILDNWLANSRKKARKIAREGGELPSAPIMRGKRATKPKAKPKGKPRAKPKSK